MQHVTLQLINKVKGEAAVQPLVIGILDTIGGKHSRAPVPLVNLKTFASLPLWIKRKHQRHVSKLESRGSTRELFDITWQVSGHTASSFHCIIRRELSEDYQSFLPEDGGEELWNYWCYTLWKYGSCGSKGRLTGTAKRHKSQENYTSCSQLWCWKGVGMSPRTEMTVNIYSLNTVNTTEKRRRQASSTRNIPSYT